MRRARAGRGVIVAAAILLASCAHRSQIWFVPNIGSPDMADLFAKPDEWPQARSRVDVFGFYAWQLAPDASCPRCGPNRLANLTRAQAFARLHDWDMRISVEAPALKPYDCEAAEGAALASSALRNLAGSGATPAYLAMDEPLFSGERCGLNDGESAARTVRYM